MRALLNRDRHLAHRRLGFAAGGKAAFGLAAAFVGQHELAAAAGQLSLGRRSTQNLLPQLWQRCAEARPMSMVYSHEPASRLRM